MGIDLIRAADDVGVDPWLLRPVMAGERRSMDLSTHHDSLGLPLESGRQPLPVLANVVDLVPGEDRDIERLVGRTADASDPGREGRFCSRQLRLEPADA